ADNVLIGGNKDDVLSGGAGDDVLLGGAGNDRIIHNVGDGNDIVDGGSETGSSNPDYDVLTINGDGVARAFTLGLATAGTPIAPATADIMVTYDGALSGSVRADEVERVIFNLGTGGDTVTLNSVAGSAISPNTIVINGGAGNDIIDLTTFAGSKVEIVDGGGAADRVKLAGLWTDYVFTQFEDVFTISKNGEPFATVQGVEFVEFTGSDSNPGYTMSIDKVVNLAPNGVPDDDSVTEAGGVANAIPGKNQALGNVLSNDKDGNFDTEFRIVDRLSVTKVGNTVIDADGEKITGTYGDLVIKADGSYVYTLDNDRPETQGLKGGDIGVENFSYSLADNQNQLGTGSLKIEVTGTNDAAEITGSTTGSVTEATSSNNAAATITGDLNSLDVDNEADKWNAVPTKTWSESGYGRFTIASDGKWSYELDNTNATVNDLSKDQTLTDAFTVTTIDGTAQVVVITINGASDNAGTGFNGKNVLYQYYYSESNSDFGTSRAVQVGSGVEINNGYQNYFSVDVQDSKIVVSFNYGVGWSPASFNGFIISDAFDNVKTINSVSDNSSKVSVSHNANSIYVNWQGSSFSAGEKITIDVGFANGGRDPIILDLDRNGFAFSSIEDGVRFDINADGLGDQIAWTSDDGILAYDVDGNGLIDNGSEIFTPDFNGGQFASGVAALASLDSNGDGKIDSDDTAFGDLKIWVDANNNGISDEGEVSSLFDNGVTSISLTTDQTGGQEDGQTIFAEGEFTFADGSTGNFVEVGFDTIFGSDADPLTVMGTDGDDILHGGMGQMVMTGGAGNDTFVFDGTALNELDVADVISDFNGDGDVLDVTALLNSLLGEQATAETAASHLRTTADDGNTTVSVQTGADTWKDVVVLHNHDTAVKVLFDDKHSVTVSHD
ncbi:VCBS domain-containing protein, partial [Rhizobium rhizophilum]